MQTSPLLCPLQTFRITHSSAKQRQGRAGRTAPGICYRLYSEEDMMAMQPSQTAEILRSPLELTVLNLKQLGDCVACMANAYPAIACKQQDPEENSVPHPHNWFCSGGCSDAAQTGSRQSNLEAACCLCRHPSWGCILASKHT